MTTREYWMVEYREKASGSRMRFKFCETRQEAEAAVREFKCNGLHAACWDL